MHLFPRCLSLLLAEARKLWLSTLVPLLVADAPLTCNEILFMKPVSGKVPTSFYKISAIQTDKPEMIDNILFAFKFSSYQRKTEKPISRNYSVQQKHNVCWVEFFMYCSWQLTRLFSAKSCFPIQDAKIAKF